MGKWTTYTVLRRWSTVACEEMFNILRHKENANQMTLSLHLTPVRMAITKKRNNNKCRWRFRDWECKLVQPLWKSVWRFLNKLNIELLHDPAIPLFGIYLKKWKSTYSSDTGTPMFKAALFAIENVWNSLFDQQSVTE
jgi:hypothetical protein